MSLLSWLQIVCKQIAILRNLFVIYHNFVPPPPMKIAVDSEVYFVVLRGFWGETPPLKCQESMIIKQQMWKWSWSRIIQKSWRCLHIIFLIICSAVTVRENWHCLIVVLIGCVKWAWRALGSSCSPILISRITSTVHVNWQALLAAETEQHMALNSELCFHAGFGSCQNSLGKCCSSSIQSFMIPLLLCLLLCS